jgi:hypothetical protein
MALCPTSSSLLLDSIKPDIICGTETWIDNSIKDSQIFPPGYNIYRNDRNLNGGGVLLAVRGNLISSPVPELQTDCEIIWCKLLTIFNAIIYPSLGSTYNVWFDAIQHVVELSLLRFD